MVQANSFRARTFVRALMLVVLAARVSLGQVVGRYRVFDAATTVDIARDGRVFGLTNTFAPDLDPTLANAEPRVDEAAARASALDALGLTEDRLRAADPFTAEL